MEKHEWKYCSLGGVIRIRIASGEDIAHLGELDEKYWTVLSCPVNGLAMDPHTLSYIDADADGNAYWSADAELEGNVVSFVWSPDRDAGCRRYAFFLSVESPSQGTIYRAFGLLVMQASPGFDPADLGAPDALQTFVEAVIDAIDGRYLIEETDPTVPAWAKAETKPSYAWSEIAGKPATYAPSAHTHAVSDISGLQTALDAKAPVSAVSMSEGGTDYVWVWDPNVGTFALTAGGAAPVYPAED